MTQVQGTLPTQQEPLFHSVKPGAATQVKNNADGFVFAVNDLMRLQRYAIIGCEGGTYYAMEEKLERENIGCVDRLIASEKRDEAIALLKDISVKRRNVKQNSLIKAFSVFARCNDEDTKTAAYAILSDICRIPTHLFMFIKFCEEESNPGTGWGRAHKRAISSWYTNFDKDPERLARLVTKFKQRENWSHKDIIRLAHTSCKSNAAVAFILRYIVKDFEKAVEMYKPDADIPDQHPMLKRVSTLLAAFDRAMATRDPGELCSMIREYKLTWEQCPSDLLRNKDVWNALLPHMPIEALVRNLGRMSALAMFAQGSEEEEIALQKIRSINSVGGAPAEAGAPGEGEEEMEVDGVLPRQQKRRNMLHPFRILIAMNTYKSGQGEKGSLNWRAHINARILKALDAAFYRAFEAVEPTNKKYFLSTDVVIDSQGEKGSLNWRPHINARILEALDAAFYQAFEAVEPTNNKYFLGIDVSGSMSQPVLGSSSVDCATAAAAMMMMTLRTEQDTILKGFSHTLRDLDIDRDDKLQAVVKKVSSVPMGATDCAQPMIHAMTEKIKDIDVFVVYTDSETWYGNVHPCEALVNYRTYSENPHVKLIVCGMCANKFSIADPEDRYMLDVCGFDSSAPKVISEFVMGRI